MTKRQLRKQMFGALATIMIDAETWGSWDDLSEADRDRLSAVCEEMRAEFLRRGTDEPVLVVGQ